MRIWAERVNWAARRQIYGRAHRVVASVSLSGMVAIMASANGWSADAVAVAPGAKVLFNLRQGVDLSRVSQHDAVVSVASFAGQPTLRIKTQHEEPWPGITLRAPGGRWNLVRDGEVAVALMNSGTNEVRVICRVDNPGADGVKNCLSDSLSLSPGRAGTLHVFLRRANDTTLDGKLFGMRGYPVAIGGAGTIDAGNITQVLLFVDRPKVDHQFDVVSVEAMGSYLAPTASVTDASPYFPLIDTMGQYKHRDWPGKVKAVAEMGRRRQQEESELTSNPQPEGWDSYGGWTLGPKLVETGYFRTEKYHGKWWLVDPEGRLFFSHGVDCVGALDSTPVDERESWFEAFPGNSPEFGDFISNQGVLKGHYAGRSPRCFSFAGANLARKYGAGWHTARREIIHRRLRSWGLNTIGNWSDQGVCQLRRTPYTDTVGSEGSVEIEGSEGYWGKFPDVFDPSFAASVRRAMEAKRGSSAGDRWCLGYFSDNEMSWGDDTSLALAALASSAGQAAKRVLLADLKERYKSIGGLNQAWGTAHKSWEEMYERRTKPDRERARLDLTAFYSRAAEKYFQTVRGAIHAVAPGQLYLGCRFAAVNDRAAQAAGKFCDVVSYNLYQRSIAGFHYPGSDKPLLVGEFHLGGLDRGMFHPGLVPVANQAARAQAYRTYLAGALRHPQFVGTHWFQWQDEPTTGRSYDEENYQIGLIDVADTPYAETVAAIREVGRHMYRERLEAP